METTKHDSPEASASAAKLGRRKVAKIAAVALVGLGSIAAAVRTTGYDALPPSVKLAWLSPWQYLLVAAVARRMLDPDAPDAPSPDAVDVAGFIDEYVAKMPPGLRADLSGLFGVVEHVAPVRAGHARRFTNLGPAEQDSALAWLERAGGAGGLFAGAFDGLRALVFMGYYRDPRTWALLGYEGPTLPRDSK